MVLKRSRRHLAFLALQREKPFNHTIKPRAYLIGKVLSAIPGLDGKFQFTAGLVDSDLLLTLRRCAVA